MKIAFRTGGVAGMFTVGLGLFGAALVVLVYKGEAPKVLEGFGFGAALLAMFMRVGGGIFTKAADVGADLVGKVEQGIPEDDPRNAATIADNVGDNVGDCAGMAADLFESYAVTLVAALILGKAAFGELGLVLPLIIPAIGVLTSVIGIFAVSPRKSDRSGMSAINRGFFISALISAVLVVVAVFVWVPESWDQIESIGGIAAVETVDSLGPRVFVIGAVFIGIILAAVIQQLTAYFTETNRRPVDDVSKTSLTGAATVILSGISLGLESAVYSALVIAAAVYGAFLLGGGVVLLSLFAIALAGTGLLTTVGVIVSMDTFGPISDNAQGIAEMSGDIDGEGAAVLTRLDAVGNSTKAITKGIAIATAVLAATALFGAFRDAIIGATEEAGGTEALHEIPGVAELTQFMETAGGREFSTAASYLNIKNGCTRSSEATRDHLQSLLNFLGENLDALHSAAVAMVEPTAKLYLFATSLIEVLSLLASLQAWADNVSRETHPPAVGAWKSDPENLEKLVAALQSVFDDRLRQEKRGGDYAPQLPQASSPARRTPWTKAAPLGTKRPAMQELVVLTLGACS